MPLDFLLLSRWWSGAVLVGLTLVSDYALTIWGARLYRGASRFIAFEGSYETVPMFQADIDAGRIVSVRFIAALIVMVAIVGSIAKFREFLGIGPSLYLSIVGFFVLIEAPIHVRHASNIVKFQLILRPGAVEGRTIYTQWYVLHVSSIDFFSFGALFLLGYVATTSWFLLGGAVRCVAFGVAQLLMSWKAGQKPATTAPQSGAADRENDRLPMS